MGEIYLENQFIQLEKIFKKGLEKNKSISLKSTMNFTKVII